MDTDISIFSLLSKLIDDENQIEVLQLISEDLFGEELLKKLLKIMED